MAVAEVLTNQAARFNNRRVTTHHAVAAVVVMAPASPDLQVAEIFRDLRVEVVVTVVEAAVVAVLPVEVMAASEDIKIG